MKTKTNDKGYLEFVDSGKLIHIWKAEKKYGKEKLKGMHVHHIDGDKKNNDNSNLILLSKEDHYDLHQYENKKQLLSGIIIVLSITYLVILVIAGFIIPSLKSFSLTIMRMAIIFILIVAIELRYNVIAGAIRRPNERVFRE